MLAAVDEVLEFVDENDIKFVRLAFCDLLGAQKNISIMSDELKRAFDIGIPFNSSLIAGYENTECGDLFLVPEPSTLAILPWRPQQGRVARFYCDIKHFNGNSFELDGRAILKNAVSKISESGYGCRVALDSKFYLFETDEEGKNTNIPYDEGTYFDIAPKDKCENIRHDICLNLEEMGIQPESSHHEFGPGQNEVDFKSSNPLKTADNFLTLKNVVKLSASRNGLYASFLPKPIKDERGNDLVISISLFNRRGKSLVEDVDDEVFDYFYAGILNRIKEITLFLNATENSYERLAHSNTPKLIAWSRENHSQVIRIPDKKEGLKRIDLRSADPYVNPYLSLSLILSAGFEGINNKSKLPEQWNGTTVYESVPDSISEAVKYAEESEFVKNVIGEEASGHFISIIKKQLEK